MGEPKKQQGEEETEGSIDSSTKAAVERIKSKVAEHEAKGDEPDDDAGDDEGEGDGPGEREEATEDDEPREQLSRREKKRNRYREANERATNAERKATELEQKLGQVVQYLQRQQPAPQQQQPQNNALQDELKAVYAERQELLDYATAMHGAGKLDDALRAKLRDREQQNDQRKIDVMTRMRYQGAGQQQSAPQQNIQQLAQMAALHMQHGDVMGNERARVYADLYYRQQEMLGKQGGPALTNEACEAARKAFGLASRAPAAAARAMPSSLKAKLSGESKGGGGGGGSDDDDVAVPWTKSTQKLARAMYPKDEPHVQKKKWMARQGKEGVRSYKASSQA